MGVCETPSSRASASMVTREPGTIRSDISCASSVSYTSSASRPTDLRAKRPIARIRFVRLLDRCLAVHVWGSLSESLRIC